MKEILALIESLLSPRGVAVVGASQDPSKLGHNVARNILHSGYQGAIHFVNPRPGCLFDRPLYPDLTSVPDPVDLAVILIPAPAVPGVLEAAGRRGIKAAIIGSGGFGEIGAEGLGVEKECLAIIERHGVRVLGPNCIGLIDTHLPLDTSFLRPPGPAPGQIAFLSHSGAICAAVIDWSRGRGFSFSRLISLGNQMDLTETDFLVPLGEDENTRVITMYIEGVRDGRKFVEEAGRVTPHKPIVALKVGRSESGSQAVASHTGALAGSDEAYEAAFRQAGVVRANTTREMFDWAKALAWCPLPEGRRVAVLTNAGGPGAIAVDALVANDLRLVRHSVEVQDRLRRILPPAASVKGPVDIVASAGPREFAGSLDLVLREGAVDAAMVIMAAPPVSSAGEIAEALIPIIQSHGKPVAMVLMGDGLVADGARRYREVEIPDFSFPEEAASALRVLAERSEFLRAPRESLPSPKSGDASGVRELLARAIKGPDGFVDARLAAEIVKAYGVRTLPEVLAQSPEEAVRAAEGFGFPVVMKIVSPDVPHKSEMGAIVLGVGSPPEAREQFGRLTRRVKDALPRAKILGVLVQPMAGVGQEVIVGVVRDPQFGPLVMFGSGGVEVEGLKDIAFALAPLSRGEIELLMDSTWAGRRMRGFRHLAPGDREAVAQAIIGLGALCQDVQQISEVEINPLRVMPGGGAVALDVRVRLTD